MKITTIFFYEIFSIFLSFYVKVGSGFSFFSEPDSDPVKYVRILTTSFSQKTENVNKKNL